jgi:hypothetical protein
LADKAWQDLLGFPSRYAARAVAIVMTEGTRDDWFRRYPPAPAPRPGTAGGFGSPEAFFSQKHRVRSRLSSPFGFGRAFVRLVRRDLWRWLVRGKRAV